MIFYENPSGPAQLGKSVETFNAHVARSPFDFFAQRSEPTCFNGIVDVRRYKITVELVPESDDVVYQRILGMWETTSNHHEWGPLQAAAKEIGRELPHDRLGKRRIK